MAHHLMSRYERSLKERRQKYLELRALLDGQVMDHQHRKAEEAAQEFEETSAQKKEWEVQQANEEAAKREEAVSQQQTYAEMLRLNRYRLLFESRDSSSNDCLYWEPSSLSNVDVLDNLVVVLHFLGALAL